MKIRVGTAVILGLFLSACQPKDQSVVWDSYRNDTLGVMLKVPHTWKRTTVPNADTSVLFYSPETSGGNGLVAIIRNDPNWIYKALSRPTHFKTRVKNKMVYSETVLKGQRAIKIVGHEKRGKRHVLTFVVRQGDHLLTITCRARPGGPWNRFRKDFNGILASLQWVSENT